MHLSSGTDKLSYSVSEACAATSLGRTTLYGLIAAGRLKSIRVGGRTLIPAEGLRALIAENGDQGRDERKNVRGGAK